MAINFLHPIFQSTVTCPTPSVDGHEVSNLLSESPRAQDEGFLMETFIKPPVNIEVTFPCSVELHRVMFSAVVGMQRTLGVEIYSSASKQRRKASREERHAFCMSEQQSGGQSSKDSTSAPIFIKLGYGNLQEKNSACFSNNRFRQRSPYKSLHSMPSRHSLDSDAMGTFTIYHHNDSQLNRVDKISVRLVRSAHGKLCALKWLEVWGQPSYSCSKETVQEILRKHSMVATPHTLSLPCASTSGTPQITPRSSDATNVTMAAPAGVNIPDEFLDPLTQELMSLPMLVPSGQTVDRSTLDRHYTQEEKWGRPPNDPFTGVTFTSASKPVPNAALKARIDQFLLLHGSQLPSMPRSLGAMQGCQSTISSLVVPLQNTFSNGSLQNPPESYSETRCSMKPISDPSRHVLANPASDTKAFKPMISRDSPLDSASTTTCATSRRRHAGDPNIAPDNRHLATKLPKLETTFPSTSIDDTLSRTLQFLPSFLKPEAELQQDHHQCSVCAKVPEADMFCYKLQCGHTICRKCLLSTTPGGSTSFTKSPSVTTICSICGSEVDHRYVSRMHITRKTVS